MKWIYKVKLILKGEVIRHKARLMTKWGFQRNGIDFDEVFAPTARIETIRLIVALSNINGCSMCQMDVMCEFPNNPLDEEVYVSQPVGFEKEGQENKVYKLHKALYGLKQSPRAWNKSIDSFLREVGFMKCENEHDVYPRRSNNNELIILHLYVYDLLITSNYKKEVEDFKLDPMKEFEMTDLGNISYFIGIEFYKYGRGLLMHQRRYASEILERF